VYRFAAHRLACHRGAAAIEFAIVLPILLLLVLGLIEVGRAIWTQTTLDYAVQAAARCYAIGHAVAGATCETAAQTQQYAVDHAPGLSLSTDIFNVTIEACDGAGGGVPGVKVAVPSLPFDWLVPALLPYSTTLSASTCFPV
jgi:Flp pilus assembly protein TadG